MNNKSLVAVVLILLVGIFAVLGISAQNSGGNMLTGFADYTDANAQVTRMTDNN